MLSVLSHGMISPPSDPYQERYAPSRGIWYELGSPLREALLEGVREGLTLPGKHRLKQFRAWREHALPRTPCQSATRLLNFELCVALSGVGLGEG